jgi:hypothetical protein
MMDAAIDGSDFNLARIADRDRRRDEQRQTKAEALAALHRARDAFVEAADHPDAASRDADRLELIADRLLDWGQTLERDLARLEGAGDRAAWRGGIQIRGQSVPETARLAAALADVVGETALGAGADSLLAAAVRHASL